jgi:hypothetical protein
VVANDADTKAQLQREWTADYCRWMPPNGWPFEEDGGESEAEPEVESEDPDEEAESGSEDIPAGAPPGMYTEPSKAEEA